jgi:hypothetical protein
MTSTLDRFRMALAMQSSCFSLDGGENMLCATQRIIHLPSREVLATLRNRRFKVTEHVDVDTVFRSFLVSRWDQVNTAQCLILIMMSELQQMWAASTDAYNFDILIFVEYVQSGAQTAAQDSWIL